MSTEREIFYKTKYENFQKFIKPFATNPKFAPLFQTYIKLNFNTFMVNFIKAYIVPNVKKLDILIEKKCLELNISCDEVGSENLDKFKRYLELFATFYE